MTPHTFLRPIAAALLLLATGLPHSAHARCIDETRDKPLPESGLSVTPTPPEPSARDQLLGLINLAAQRSQAVGAARLLAEASASDIEEARAGGLPQASLTGFVGAQGSATGDTDTSFGSSSSGGQARATLNVGAPLFDFGRVDRLTQWRTALADAARLNQLTAEEQVALQVVALSFERSRFRLQSQVYRQYAEKMACLSEALGEIVKADKGRLSELVQARKTQAQAELAFEQSQTALRQMEVRLRRYVGDQLPPGGGLAWVLGPMPELNEIWSDLERSTEIAALDAQARAADRYAESVVAAQKPQVGFAGNASKALGAGNPRSWSVGLTVTVPLLNPGADAQASSARKRAEAARMQVNEGLQARKSRAAEVHEQGSNALDRARRTSAILRDSDSVRNYTLQQWQQLGRRSLFDVMSAEGEHYGLRVAYVNALYDALQANALLRSMSRGLSAVLQ